MSQENKHKDNNKLLQEKSPYLLQHAHNPVDWYPWGGEAFARAVAEDKPIFLSIGYSCCHWCHVMERESFEDEEVASVLNKSFISIKVDREERPDIDHIYMNVCQVLTGSGGWPLTILMTPDRKPFFAGTYFPKKDRMGHPGLIEILDQISNLWINERDKVDKSVDSIMQHMENTTDTDEHGEITKDILDIAFNNLKSAFDSLHGGFGKAPKFPTPHNLCFLLRYYNETKNEEALHIVEKTLESMYRGGMYDHIGFGFSRYSTDRKWLVPHFEKMLYDNALISIAYLEVYQLTKKEAYKNVAGQIFEYILRDMTSEDGAFYSAEDADSEDEEGKFYVWMPEELEMILGQKEGKIFAEYFDVTEAGNFEGENIPNLINNESPFQRVAALPMDESRDKIFKYREDRIHPYKDDKILTAWNGLMIAAMAYGARVLSDNRYRDAAENAIGFIKKHLVREDGRLLARYRDGESAYPAYIDDYAFLVWGLIELYETTFSLDYLEFALKLNEDMIKYFHDEKNGGFYIYGSDSEELIARPKDIYDGATPSGNSVATLNLLRLSRITGRSELEDMAHMQFKAFSKSVAHYPSAYSYFMMSVIHAYSKAREIVLVGKREDTSTQKLMDKINSNYMPNTVVVFKDINENQTKINKLINYVEHNEVVDNKATAYVCEGFACKAPINDWKELEEILNS